MHRITGLVSIAAIAALVGLLALGILTTRTAAQEGTPAVPADHPFIGAWLLDTNVDDPSDPPSLVIFHDDGTYSEADPGGTDGVGAWEATGPNTANLTIVFNDQDESGGFAGTAKVRATGSVDASGDTFTAEYTLDFTDPAGTSSGEMGPATARGERITVEPMGTPTAPMPMEATPAA